MRIQKISIKKYLMLKNLELDFSNGSDVYDTIVFAGENGTGKTTILELLFAFTKPADLDLKNIGFLGSIEYSITPSEWQKFLEKERSQSLFSIKEQIKEKNIDKIVIVISGPLQEIGGKLTGWEVQFYQQEVMISTASRHIILKNLGELSQSAYQSAEINFMSPKITSITTLDVAPSSDMHIRSSGQSSVQIAQLLVDVDTIDNRELAEWVDKNPGQVVPENVKHSRINRFNNAFKFIFHDLSLTKIESKNGEHQIIFSNYGENVLLNSLSSGEKQIIFRGGFFLKNKTELSNLLAFVDEPEISLHPKWQQKILQFYRKILTDGDRRSQLFVATHSPFVVHSEMKNTKYIVLKRDNLGEIIVEDNAKFPDFSGEKLVQEAFNINLYKNEEKKILFVEDNSHEMVAKELLKDQEIKIKKLGSCDKVLACSEALNDKDNFFFLVDGDRKNGLEQTKQYAKHTLRLNKYCIENYLFDRDVFLQVLQVCQKEDEPESFIKKVIDQYNPADSKFDRIRTLFEYNQFSFEKLDDTDCSELMKQLEKKDFLNRKHYELVSLFIEKAKELGKFEKLFSEILCFLEIK